MVGLDAVVPSEQAVLDFAPAGHRKASATVSETLLYSWRVRLSEL